MKRRITITNDGSSTIYMEEMDENYHSSYGAIQEAKHVFIKNGLDYFNLSEISIFELGFGTGLNALLTLKHAQETCRKVNYFGIEAYPIEQELLQQLNYTESLGYVDQFELMHEVSWNVHNQLTDFFWLTKIDQKIQEYLGQNGQFDLIYFDAFGHRAQHELWDISILSKMYDLLKQGGILVTYAARGQFKRDLKSLGFEVESLPGPPGKREMTRAIKS